jgi:hypothetical protein
MNIFVYNQKNRQKVEVGVVPPKEKRLLLLGYINSLVLILGITLYDISLFIDSLSSYPS